MLAQTHFGCCRHFLGAFRQEKVELSLGWDGEVSSRYRIDHRE
ncbi:hypothetical protein [Dapis sp. BLCC M126]